MATIRSLIVRVGADLTQFEKGMRNMEKQLKNTGKNLQNIGRNLTMYVTAPILAAGTAMTKMAMDAVESENLFEVSMGGMADSARTWSEELRKQLGLNSFEVRKNVSTFNVMFDSMGISTQGAYEMSKGLTQLAYDMSSFYNLKPEEAFIKLQAGITGETEPLKRLGILVDETTTKTYAYANGIAEQGQELTQQQKLLARYVAIMDQTSKAQGDLARTADSPTNKLRIMTANIQQMAIEIGMKLIPMFEKILEYVQKVVKWFDNLSDAQLDNIIKFAMYAAAAGPVILALGKITSFTAGAIKGVGNLGKALLNLSKIGAGAGAAGIGAAGVGTVAGIAGIVGIGAAVTAGAYALDKWKENQAKQDSIDLVKNSFNPLLGDTTTNPGKPMGGTPGGLEQAARELEKHLGIPSGAAITESAEEASDWLDQLIKEIEEYRKSLEGLGDTGVDAMTDFASSIKGVIDAIRSQTDAFANFTGLFDIFERKYVSGDRLMNRLKAQVKAMGEWQNSLVAIQAKGVSEQFLQTLRMMGPGAVDQVNALAKMSPEQLQQYEGLYNQKNGIAGTQAGWAQQTQTYIENQINLEISGNNISSDSDTDRIANQIIGKLRYAGIRI